MDEENDIQITEDELVAAVLASYVDAGDDRGMTTVELIEQTGKSSKWIYIQLRRLRSAGRLELARRQLETIDGRLVTVPAYVLKSETK